MALTARPLHQQKYVIGLAHHINLFVLCQTLKLVTDSRLYCVVCKFLSSVGISHQYFSNSISLSVKVLVSFNIQYRERAIVCYTNVKSLSV